MKWMFCLLSFCLISSSLAFSVESDDNEEEAGDARLGYVTVNADGSTSLTFNATSIQNAVLLGLFILVLGALLVPFYYGDYSGSGYSGSGSGGYSSGGSGHASSGYGHYSKRSAEFMGPVLDSLSSARKKYEDEQ